MAGFWFWACAEKGVALRGVVAEEEELGATLGGAGACFFVPLRTKCGLGPLEADAGATTVSCPGVPLGPPGPFLRGGGVEAGSRTTLLFSSADCCWFIGCWF